MAASGKKLLLVEPFPGASRFAREKIEEIAWTDLSVAEEPAAAFSMLARQSYDLVLIDLVPGKNLVPLAEKLAAAAKSAPLLALVPAADPELFSELIEKGVLGCLELQQLNAAALDLEMAKAQAIKQMEKAQEEELMFYKSMLDQLNEVLYYHELRPRPRVRFVSSSCRFLTGYSPEDYYQDPDLFLRMVHPEDRPRVEKLFQGKADYSLPFRFRLVTKEGKQVWTEQNIAPVYDNQGELIALAALARNITETRNRELEQEQKAKLYESIFSSVPDMLMVFDRELRVVFANQPMLEELGLSIEEVMGMEVTEVLPRELLQQGSLLKKLYEVKEKGGEERLDGVRHFSSQHPEKTLNLKIRELKDAGEASLILVITDVTKESELQKQLFMAQKLESASRLALGIVSNLNNKLSIVTLGASTLLKHFSPEDSLWTEIQEMESAAERAAHLSRQLLTFASKDLTEPAPISLNQEVERSAELLKSTLGELIELELELEKELPSIEADPGLINQLINNLAINAKEAMPEGGTLTIKTQSLFLRKQDIPPGAGLSPGRHVLLTIKDTGVGMDEQTLSRIFEPFFTTKPEGMGTGLGLAVVYGIVKQSQGHIAVKSKPGQGTEFTIYFPAIAAKEKEDQDEKPKTSPQPELKANILGIVEEDFHRKMYKRNLEQEGNTVLAARSGEEAMQMAQARDFVPDILLMDLETYRQETTEHCLRLVEQFPSAVPLLITDVKPDERFLRRCNPEIMRKPMDI